jgi:hypothetical protein
LAQAQYASMNQLANASTSTSTAATTGVTA